MTDNVKLTTSILRMVADAMGEAHPIVELREVAARIEIRTEKLRSDGYSEGYIEDALLRRYRKGS